MAEDWLSDTLLSIDEKVRVELGPQVLKMPCTDANLSDSVTHPKYRVGARDAHGLVIGTDIKVGSDDMHVVDWRCKSAPQVWKIYAMTDGRFVQVDQRPDRDDAVARAREILKEMN